jgi:DsbC/DsbD-like thiol-disulfide interchange protein
MCMGRKRRQGLGERMIRFRTLIAIVAITATSQVAHAIESQWVQAEHSTVRLLADGNAGAGDARLRGGVEIKLTRGWHTYWRYPGDAGVPPRFDWSGSENVAAVEVLWPAPVRIPDGSGGASIGYLDEVLFPLRIRAADASRPMRLRLTIDYAVCERICIPASARAQLGIEAGAVGSVPRLQEAEARVPRPSKLGESGTLAIRGLKLERGARPRAIAEVAAPAGRDLDLFAEGPGADWALPLPAKLPGADVIRFAVPLDGAPSGADPVPPRLRLTLVAGNEAIEVDTPLD